MRSILVLTISLLSFHCLCAGEWYEQLRPGVTRGEIHRLARVLPTESGDKEICQLAQGRIELTYRGEILLEATHVDPPGGGSRTLYSTNGESLESDIEARREFVRRSDFENLPKFKGGNVRTQRYIGPCYVVDDGFLVVESLSPLMGASGLYANKTRRLLLVRSDGSEETLYSAFDHWPQLRPRNLSTAQLDERLAKLRSVSPKTTGDSVVKLLGRGDSIMGSGFSYEMYYLASGLAVVRNSAAPAENAILFHRLDNTVASFAEWLKDPR